jgi:hypothetical protein
MSAIPKTAKALANKLLAGITAFSLGPCTSDTNREVILGVTPRGTFVQGMTASGFITKVTKILQDSGKTYRWGNSICLEKPGTQGPELYTLSAQHRAEPGAAEQLANLFCVAAQEGSEVVQAFPPPRLVSNLLADNSLWTSLPIIKYYSRRPVFSLEFELCKPGWNPVPGILFHGEPIEPYMYEPPQGPEVSYIDRLPPHLRNLLFEFDWRSNCDLANTVALMLSGLLVNHFIDDPHPLAIIDGNQPGLGKTLLMQVIGQVLDGIEPPKIAMTTEEELEKRLCAMIRTSTSSLAFFDNIRGRIDSPILEQCTLSPMLSFRILGQSMTIERPNTLLWAITSNSATGTPDLIRRSIPIRLYHEGDPKSRTFDGNPLRYAKEHRIDILGELAGLVVHWVQQGKPKGHHKHRCDRWAATIGGILNVCGLGDVFLKNLEEAEAEMDEGQQDLTALAEYVARNHRDGFVEDGSKPVDRRGHAPADWVRVFTAAQVCSDQLLQGGERAKATNVGKALKAWAGHQIDIETPDGPQIASLRSRSGRSRQKYYWFELKENGNPSGMSAVSSPSTGLTDLSSPTSLEARVSPAEAAKHPSAGPAAQTSGSLSAQSHSGESGEAGNDSKPIWF